MGQSHGGQEKNWQECEYAAHTFKTQNNMKWVQGGPARPSWACCRHDKLAFNFLDEVTRRV
jgi:hypothetical protein